MTYFKLTTADTSTGQYDYNLLPLAAELHFLIQGHLDTVGVKKKKIV